MLKCLDDCLNEWFYGWVNGMIDERLSELMGQLVSFQNLIPTKNSRRWKVSSCTTVEKRPLPLPPPSMFALYPVSGGSVSAFSLSYRVSLHVSRYYQLWLLPQFGTCRYNISYCTMHICGRRFLLLSGNLTFAAANSTQQ